MSNSIRETLSKNILADGFEPILDLDKSHESWIVDKVTGDEYLDMLSRMKFCKNWPYEEIKKYLNNPLHYGMMAVSNGDADGLVAGAITPTSEVIRSSIRIIGINKSCYLWCYI